MDLIWTYSSDFRYAGDLSLILAYSNIRTNFCRQAGYDFYNISAIGTIRSSFSIEVLQLNNYKPYVSNYLNYYNKVTNLSTFAQGASKLKKVNGVLVLATSGAIIGDNSFEGCNNLEQIYIANLKSSIRFSSSPKITYDSIRHLITYAINSSPITITVNATTYSYLTGTARPTPQVGGTTEEWQALVTTAQGKDISFASA